MPVDIKIEQRERIVFRSFRGDVSENDVVSVRERLLREPLFDPNFSHVIDFTEVNEIRVSSDFIRGFANKESIFAEGVRQIVVAPQEHIYGLARMAQILRQLRTRGMNIDVVRCKREARKSLGITDAENK